MTDSQKKFNTIFINEGGIIDYNLFDETTVISLKYLLGDGIQLLDFLRKENPNNPPVYIDYIFNHSLNAVAGKKDGEYFIGINVGTVYLLHQLFFRMLSSPNILKEWGDCTLETNPKKIFNAQITSTLEYFEAEKDVEKIIPNDIGRQFIAELLTIYAFNFLVTHEYAHIIFGHLDFKINKTKSKLYLENDNQNELEPLLKQTLEFDADCYGTKIGVLSIFENQFGIFPPVFDSFIFDFNSNLSLWFFAIYSFFKLFGLEKIDLNSLDKRGYPTSGMRQAFVIATINAVVKKKNGDLINFENDVKNVEMAFDEISEQGFDATVFLTSIKGESLVHAVKVIENWNNVRPLLEPFSFANLAPLTGL